MTMPPEQVKAKAYLQEKGTQAPVAQIRERVQDAEGITLRPEVRLLEGAGYQ